MAKYRYCVQCVRKTDDTAEERKSGDGIRAENKKNGGSSSIKTGQASQVAEAPNVRGEVPTSDRAPEFCSLSAKTALQLVTGEGNEI